MSEIDRLRKNVFDNLQEIEQLKTRYSNLVEEHKDTITRNEDYRARIDKAIEHLKEVMKDEEEYEDDYIYNKYLLDILQGSDK